MHALSQENESGNHQQRVLSHLLQVDRDTSMISDLMLQARLGGVVYLTIMSHCNGMTMIKISQIFLNNA